MDTLNYSRPPKAKKVETVGTLKEKVKRARGIYLTEYKGLKVSEITDLRRQCHEGKVDFVVCKNTFARRVMRDLGRTEVLDRLIGPTAIAFGYDDPAVAAKILHGFAAKNEKLVLKGGIVEGRPITAKDIEAIKDLPSRDQALAMLLGALFGPVQGFHNVVTGILRDFVSVIDQIIEQKKAAA